LIEWLESNGDVLKNSDSKAHQKNLEVWRKCKWQSKTKHSTNNNRSNNNVKQIQNQIKEQLDKRVVEKRKNTPVFVYLVWSNNDVHLQERDIFNSP